MDMRGEDQKMGYWSVVAIGVGGMVGGGIFAVLGLSVQLTRGAAPVAFLIAGLVALATSYSYTRLSVAYPNEGGTVAFLDNAFGAGLFTGALNVLLWVSYIVMLSLYAYAFGSYAAAMFPEESRLFWKHVLISGSILGITGLNLLSARFIGEVESWIVAVKVAILLLFVAAGLLTIDPQRLLPAQWSTPVQIAAGGMIIFLAYEGFELIANTAGDVQKPDKTLPRAFYSAVGFVICLYIMLAAKTGSRRWIPLLGVGLCLGALGSLMWEIGHRTPSHLWILLFMLLLSFLVEGGYRFFKQRRLKVPISRKAGPTR